MRCITSAKFSMRATVLSQVNFDLDALPETFRQDPDTGDIVRVWTEQDSDPVETGIQPRVIKCKARGIISKTTRGEGTSRGYNAAGILEDTDYIMINFPANVIVTKRDRITDIKNRKGVVLWKEEEYSGHPPTIFDVMGVTPMFDPFGLHIENHALLARAEVQGG